MKDRNTLIALIFECNLSAQISSSADEIASVSNWFDGAATWSATSCSSGARVVGWVVIVDVGVDDDGFISNEENAVGIERDLCVSNINGCSSSAISVFSSEDVGDVSNVSIGVGVGWSAVDLSSEAEMTTSTLALASFVVERRGVGVNVESVVSGVPDFISRGNSA